MNIKNYFENKINYEVILDKTVRILIVLILSIIIYYIVRAVIKHFFSLSVKTKRRNIEHIRKRQRTIQKVVLSLWRYFMYFVTLLFLLSAAGINVQTILAGAGILGVIAAVGSQNLLKDFLEGFFNVFENNLSDGDYIGVDNCEGTIIDIGLRNIKIKSYSGEIHIIPNSKIGHLINYSLEDGFAIVDVTVDYEMEVDRVLAVIKDTFSKIKKENVNILSDITLLGINTLENVGYQVRFMFATVKETHWGLQRLFRAELLKAFKENNILIGVNQILVKR